MISAVQAKKRLDFHFPDAASSVLQVLLVILLSHSTLLLCPMWNSRDIWQELFPFVNTEVKRGKRGYCML